MSVNARPCVVEENIPFDNVTEVKKDIRATTWSNKAEMLLATLKQAEFKRDVTDRQYRMTPADQKWNEISVELEKEGIFQSGPQCKKKWANVLSDFKKVLHYHLSLGAKTGGVFLMWQEKRLVALT